MTLRCKCTPSRIGERYRSHIAARKRNFYFGSAAGRCARDHVRPPYLLPRVCFPFGRESARIEGMPRYATDLPETPITRVIRRDRFSDDNHAPGSPSFEEARENFHVSLATLLPTTSLGGTGKREPTNLFSQQATRSLLVQPARSPSRPPIHLIRGFAKGAFVLVYAIPIFTAQFA